MSESITLSREGPFRADGPTIARMIDLNLQGDWGGANFHRICSWLSQEVIDRTLPGSRVKIWSGRGGKDAADAVMAREVDMAITTPVSFVAMAGKSLGPFEGGHYRDLRALAVLPQVDRMIFAVRADLGIASFEELRVKKPPLRIAVGVDDGENLIGWCGRRVLEAEGITEAVLKSWGGEFIAFERPDACLDLLMAGGADAVMQEAIMAPWWHHAAEEVALNFLSSTPDALAEVKQRYGWKPAGIKAGYYTGLDHDLTGVDYSDFALLVHKDLDEDLAHLLTWCLVETREAIERQYRHIPPARSPLSYPLVPKKMAKAPIPLHPGARRYFEEAGHLKPRK